MRRRLLVLDVDSTLITAEQIDLLAAEGGVQGDVAAITERAMRGELDFADSLRQRVAALTGVSVRVFDSVLQQMEFTAGAQALIATCTERGWPVGLVSGGFHELIDPLVAELDIRRVRANRLEIHDGHLTGRVLGQIVDRRAKETFLRELASDCDIPMQDTVAIGDGANDLDMIEAAGIGVAFAAKPILRAAADLMLPGPPLDGVLAQL